MILVYRKDLKVIYWVYCIQPTSLKFEHCGHYTSTCCVYKSYVQCAHNNYDPNGKGLSLAYSRSWGGLYYTCTHCSSTTACTLTHNDTHTCLFFRTDQGWSIYWSSGWCVESWSLALCSTQWISSIWWWLYSSSLSANSGRSLTSCNDCYCISWQGTVVVLLVFLLNPYPSVQVVFFYCGDQ